MLYDGIVKAAHNIRILEKSSRHHRSSTELLSIYSNTQPGNTWQSRCRFQTTSRERQPDSSGSAPQLLEKTCFSCEPRCRTLASQWGGSLLSFQKWAEHKAALLIMLSWGLRPICKSTSTCPCPVRRRPALPRVAAGVRRRRGSFRSSEFHFCPHSFLIWGGDTPCSQPKEGRAGGGRGWGTRHRFPSLCSSTLWGLDRSKPRQASSKHSESLPTLRVSSGFREDDVANCIWLQSQDTRQDTRRVMSDVHWGSASTLTASWRHADIRFLGQWHVGLFLISAQTIFTRPTDSKIFSIDCVAAAT